MNHCQPKCFKRLFRILSGKLLPVHSQINTAEAKGEAGGEARGIKKTAINMIKQNLDFKLISQVTGLSEQEVQNLKDHFN